MVRHPKPEPADSVAGTLSRAFSAEEAKMPRAMAEMILNAKLPDSDKRRVDSLLERKWDRGLSKQEEAVLQDYLQVDSLLTILTSGARRVLAESAAA